MTNCPHCDHELTPEQWSTGQCPRCQGALNEAAGPGFFAASLEWDPRALEPDMDDADDAEFEGGPPVDESTEKTVLSTHDPALSGSWKASFTPPTSDELRSLAREWSDIRGAAAGVSIEASRDDEGTPAKPLSILDSVRRLPRRKLKAADQKVEHPEYELLNVLGEGGMGVVWDARQVSIDRTVAVKMIQDAQSQKPQQRNKFLAEAVVTGDLDHPNIVPIYDVGTDFRGKLFYAMKRVHGTPWLHVLNGNSLHENLQVLLRTADAVAFAHARGIIHRDIKPENVMLGDFGEVLLMDWGLALPTKAYRKAEKLEFTTSLAGTPAYMAPEMAKGPADAITIASDIYLLGATLYHIITGVPPHHAPDVKACLVAAMRNRITETNQQGELLDIALKAMATRPADRYESVRALQTAIQEYLAHEESISLAVRARQELEVAESSGEYRDFARALFGFEEAYELWNGNEDAEKGISEAKLSYSWRAYLNGDFDLGLSLLDKHNPEHVDAHRQLTLARREARARARRLRYARVVTGTLATLLFVGAVTFGVYYKNSSETIEAQAAQRMRDAETIERQGAQRLADAQTIEAQAKRTREQAQTIEDNARIIETNARIIEDQSRQRLVDAQKIEEAAQVIQMKNQELELAYENEKEAKEEEQYNAYVAGIGAAAARIEEGAFDVARQLLGSLQTNQPPNDLSEVFFDDQAGGPAVDAGDPLSDAPPPDYRNWEWGRLMFLCNLEEAKSRLDEPVEALAISPDGSKLAVGSRDHFVWVFDMQSRELLASLRHGGSYVHSVAWSHDGRTLATGSSDANGYVQLWDIDDILSGAEPKSRPVVGVNPDDGHTEPVCSVEFSPDDDWLLSCSFDHSARLWDLSNPDNPPRLVQVLADHDWWVWDGAFAPGFHGAPSDLDEPDPNNCIVTVGQDGLAIVWTYVKAADPGEVGPDLELVPNRLSHYSTFVRHSGPIYSVDVTRTDNKVWIATGGQDHQVMLWHPEDALPYETEMIFDPAAKEPNYRDKYREQFRLTEHTDSVESVRFSRDGHLLVTAGRDKAVWVWNLEGRRQPLRLRGHSNEVHDAVITPDGRHVISADLDGEILIWEAGESREFRALAGNRFRDHQNEVLSARFSSDDERVVTASSDRSAKIWETDGSADAVSLQEGHAYLVTSAVLFPDGLTLATAAADSTVRLWDIRRGTERIRLEGTGWSAAMALSRDARYLITGGSGDTVQIWDTSRVLEEPDYRPVEHSGEDLGQVTAAACSPTGNLAATGYVKGGIALWNLETGDRIWFERFDRQRINALQFSGDGSELFVASAARVLTRVRVEDGAELFRTDVTGPVTAFDFNDAVIVAASATVVTDADGTEEIDWGRSSIMIWDAAGAQQLVPLNDLPFAVRSITIVPGGNEALVACSEVEDPDAAEEYDAILSLPLNGESAGFQDRPPLLRFDRSAGALAAAVLSEDGTRLVTMNGSDARMFDLDAVRSGQTTESMVDFRSQDALADAQFSPNGELIVTGSLDGTVRIWSSETHKTIRTIQAHKGPVNCVAFSPDGLLILTAGVDGLARLWNVETGEAAGEPFAGHTAAINQASFSPDGMLVLTASADGTARIWNANSREQLGDPIEHGNGAAVFCAAFSADGTRIITGGEDSDARVWTADGGELLAVLSGHTATVTSASFSGDGSRAFTTSRDRTTKVWDVSEQGLAFAVVDENEPVRATDLLTLRGHTREVTSVAVSSDDRKVLTGSRDGTAILWEAVDWRTEDQVAPIAFRSVTAR